MQFNSYIFIMAFLPLLIITYFTLNKITPTCGIFVLIIGSALFYLYGDWYNAFFLGISILVNYCIAMAIVHSPKKRALLILDIICNIVTLLCFKYINYFIAYYNATLEEDQSPLKAIILPLGISFLTFQQIMYTVNVSQGKISPNLLDYLAYILYFPKILMGPLNEPEGFMKQLNDNNLKKIDWYNIACGIKTFSFGLFKKVILADTFAAAVNWGYSNLKTATSMDLILIMLSYTFEIYFDFSGYSDMAAGVSSMLNIQLPINFDSPYKAVSIRDFWKRWHISLTAFFTKYIYIPLGGSKKGKSRTYLNTMIVFLVSGIWHGSNWTFILWGFLHGAFSIYDRIFEKQQKKINVVVRWGATFLSVNILWLLFRSESIVQWASILDKIFTFQDMSVSDGLIRSFVLPEMAFILESLHLVSINGRVRGFSMLLFILSGYGICLMPENNYRNLKKNSWFLLVPSSIAFIWSFLCLSSESVFVYFNF